MRNISKRLLSFLLAFVMVMSMTGVSALQVFAEEEAEVASYNGAGYSTLEEAISLAESAFQETGAKQTVTLVSDLVAEDVTVPNGVILDCNSKAVTVTNLAVFGSIVNTGEGGSLRISGSCSISDNHSAMPVYVADGDYYVLHAYTASSLGVKQINGKLLFGYAPKFADAAAYNSIIAGGKVNVSFRLEWTGCEKPLTFQCSDALMAQYAQMARNYMDTPATVALQLAVTGVEALKPGADVCVTPVLTNGLGMSVSGEAMHYVLPGGEEEIQPGHSDKENSDYMYALDEDFYQHMQAQTTVSVQEVREGVFPRVGLRLTNEADATLDFVIAYSNAGAFWPDGFYIVTLDAEGNENKPWIPLDAGILSDDQDVTLKVEKLNNTLYFYVNGVLATSGYYAGFGVSEHVKTSLYSKYATADFSDYSVTELHPVDSDKENVSHVYAIGEPAQNVCVQTKLSVSAVKADVYPRSGLRLTNGAGATLDFVIAYNKDTSFWADGFYIVTTDAEGNETTKWVNLTAGTMASDQDVALKVEKVNNTLYFYVNDVLGYSGYFAGFGLHDQASAALYSKYATTDFSDYSVTELRPVDSDKENVSHVYAIGEPALNVSVQTKLSVSAVKADVYPRIGLRLTNEAGLTLDFVISYNKDTAFWADGFYIVTTDAEGNENTKWVNLTAGTMASAQDVTLKVEKLNNTLYFYVNGVYAASGSYAGFGRLDPVTAALYSKYATTDFSDYGVTALQLDRSDKENSNHQYLLSEPALDVAAVTKLSVSEVKADVYPRIGLRLTNEAGAPLDFVISYNKNTAFWADGFYIVTLEAEGKEVTKWVELTAGTMSNAQDVTLQVEKRNGTLYFYVNGVLGYSGSFNGFGIHDRVTTALYSKYATASFSEYSVTELHPENADKESSNHLYRLSESAVNVSAQTTLAVSEVKAGVYARSGLRLTNAAGLTLDFVIAYSNGGAFWPNGYYIVTTDAEGKETTKWMDLESGILPDDQDVTMKVEKNGENLSFYFGDTLVLEGTYAGFGAEDAVTAALYSRYATTVFTDYSAS